MTSARLSLAQALAPPAPKDRTPPVADGTLTITPDPPEWGSRSVLDQLTEAGDGFLCSEDGKVPNELFGKFTWKIEKFSTISKREMRSTVFDVGEYKWYILVYPQGCDVCNHLSLFLCVADYDKLLPGWSHFAQFTIAVVNKDPKKSKYSDTLHRFCKKEHDWGWKKFMELSKVLDGFTVADTLVIKAQVQVILDRPSRPFRCLDAQYRHELVRVYLTNVESICRRFCEEKRTCLAWLRTEGPSFRAWWRGLAAERQRELTLDKGDAILKGLVKQFFNEKEVTSTLVMDALSCGCRQLAHLSKSSSKVQNLLPEGAAAPCVMLNSKTCTFSFALDALEVIAQLNQDFLPNSKDDKPLSLGADGMSLRSGCDELSELRRDALERDEKRLAELGRRTVEMFALAHIFTEVLERAYRDHQAELRMRDLIAEEEAAGRLQDERAAARAAADKERKAKKRERQKAKKDAERAKREAEAAEQTNQVQQQRAEQQQQQQEEEPPALQQVEGHQQQQADKTPATRSRQLQPLPNGNLPSSSDTGQVNSGCSQQQQQPSSSSVVKQQQQGTTHAHPLEQHSSTTCPASGPVASDTSSSGSDDNSDVDSSSKGFAPVVRAKQQQQQQSASSRHASQHGAGGYGATHNLHYLHPIANGSSSNCTAGIGSSYGSSSSGSIPTGYAAAVAGMKPPPPAEVTAAALAMAEQHRQMRQLEDQVTSLKQQAAALEALVSHQDVLLAQKDHDAGEMRQQLVQQAQQIQELRKQLAGSRAAAAAVGSSSHSCGTAEVKSFAAVAAGLAGGSAAGSRASSRSRGTSVDLSDGLTVAPTSTPAAWGAHPAAGTAATATIAAACSGGVADSSVGPVNSQDLGQVQQLPPAAGALGSEQQLSASSSSRSSSSSAGDGHTPDVLGRGLPVSYVGSVAGQPHQQHRPVGRHTSGGGNGSTTPVAANSSTTPGDAVSSSPACSQQQQDSAPSSRSGTPLALQSGVQPFHSSSAIGDGAVPGSSSSGPPTLQEAASAGPGSLDKPVSLSNLARSITTGAAAPGYTSTSMDSSRALDSSLSSSSIPGSSSQAVERTATAAAATSSRHGGSSGGSSSRSIPGSNERHGSSLASNSLASSSLPDGLSGLSLKVTTAVGAGSYLSNGIAGVLHSSTPLREQSSSGQLTQAHRDAAGALGGSTPAPAGSGSIGTPESMLSGSSVVQGPPSSSSRKSKLPAAPQQHSFGAFGSQMAPGARDMFGPIPAAKGEGRASQSSILEDNGLDGFVHMNMIDDLLTE